jgi:CheY-like chemotaxis protein
MRRRVLLVDNHPDTIEVMCLELRFLGYEVIVATDGAEAVEKAGAEAPDIIVMDVCLPGIDGFEAMSIIRNNTTKTQSILVLASTAMARPGDKQKCLAAGFNGYIAKPFTHKELGTALKDLLKDRID